VAVAVDEESSAGYMIKPGDYVDALLTYESGGERKNGTVTATILQSIQVVAAGSGPEGEGSDKKYNTISLAVTAEEAELLVFAGARGRITFTLRPVGETGREKLKAATFEELIKQVKANEKSAPQSYAPAPGTNNNDADDVSKREE
jgi:Flp pilus assembly protein CpaB